MNYLRNVVNQFPKRYATDKQTVERCKLSVEREIKPERTTIWDVSLQIR